MTRVKAYKKYAFLHVKEVRSNNKLKMDYQPMIIDKIISHFLRFFLW